MGAGCLVRAACVLAAVLCGRAHASDVFVVGPGDRLAVTVHRRADLSGEFRVLPGGALSLPFLGTLGVAGQSVEDVREAVARRLREDAGLLDPRVSVEIAEMQPILVAGGVRRPGGHPYLLGMTVGHALASAGGPRRLELEEVGAHVEIVRLRERLRQSQESYGLALVRHARWTAELSGGETFETPAEAGRYLTRERMLQASGSESELMSGRNGGFASLLAMLTAQTAALNDEIQALRETAAAKEQEQALLQQETRYVDSLMRQGLTPRTSRVIELSRLAVQVDGERRQLMSSMARARQEVARVAHTRANAVNARRQDAAAGIKEAEDRMAELRIAMEESRAGLGRLRESLPEEDGPVGARGLLTAIILRSRTTPPQRIEADAATPLMPGDLVEFGPASSSGGRLAFGVAR